MCQKVSQAAEETRSKDHTQALTPGGYTRADPVQRDGRMEITVLEGRAGQARTSGWTKHVHHA